jgi:hypothetical protein
MIQRRYRAVRPLGWEGQCVSFKKIEPLAVSAGTDTPTKSALGVGRVGSERLHYRATW